MKGPERLELASSLRREGFDLELDLTLPAMGITVIFGPSGCGKTSLLRCVAGLERHSTGRIALGASVMQDSQHAIHWPTWQRPLAYVFQEASLFEHLDVMGNLRFGLNPKRLHNKRSPLAKGVGELSQALSPKAALEQAIEVLGLGALMKRHPQQLSGGERQRVAIGRALATQPRLMLLDEPLASLDSARQQEILPWLEKLRDTLHVPMLYVTHAQSEMTRLANTLVLMEQGRVRAAAPIQEMFAHASWQAELGDEPSALIDAQLHERDEPWGLVSARFEGGAFWIRDPELALGSRVRLRVMARDVSIACSPPERTSIQNILPARVSAIHPDHHPSQRLVRLELQGTPLWAKVTTRALNALALEVGQAVWAQIKSVALVS